MNTIRRFLTSVRSLCTYRPSVAVLNNLEFDHADIYPTMRELTRQFHYFLRTLPDNGRIIARAAEANIADAVRLGAYAPIEWIGRQKQQAWSWRYRDGEMCVYRRNEECCRLSPPLPGAANRDNMLAAIAAAAALGADAEKMPDYLRGYLPPLRRMQKIGEVNGARIFDDFAHHPTAIKKTIAALAETRPARGRIIAVFEPRSNSMKAGVFEKQLARGAGGGGCCRRLRTNGVAKAGAGTLSAAGVCGSGRQRDGGTDF